MNLLFRAGATALALICSSAALAQHAERSAAPAGYAPEMALVTVPATSAPLHGTVTNAAVTPSSGGATISGGVATIGPLSPQLGRDIRVILRPAANTTFTFALGTSTDACATINPLTIGGMAWGTFIGAANEAVDTPTVSGVVYCATATVTTGTLTYVVRQ